MSTWQVKILRRMELSALYRQDQSVERLADWLCTCLRMNAEHVFVFFNGDRACRRCLESRACWNVLLQIPKRARWKQDGK